MHTSIFNVVLSGFNGGFSGVRCVRTILLALSFCILTQSGNAFSQDQLKENDLGKYTLTDKAGAPTVLTVRKVHNGFVIEFYLGELHYWWDAEDGCYYRRGSLYALYFEYLSPNKYKYMFYDTWWNRVVSSGSVE